MGEMFECILFTASLAKVCQCNPLQVLLIVCFSESDSTEFWHLRAGTKGALSLSSKVS